MERHEISHKLIHQKKVRPVGTPSKKEILGWARGIVGMINRNPHIRENELARLPNTAIRFDMGGAPEVSFVIKVKDGRLEFASSGSKTDIAIGMQKDFFMNLYRYPPTPGNMKILFNNIILRKGRIRKFKQLKSTIVAILSESYRWNKGNAIDPN